MIVGRLVQRVNTFYGFSFIFYSGKDIRWYLLCKSLNLDIFEINITDFGINY